MKKKIIHHHIYKNCEVFCFPMMEYDCDFLEQNQFIAIFMVLLIICAKWKKKYQSCKEW